MLKHCGHAYDLHSEEPSVLIELGILYLYLVRTEGPDARCRWTGNDGGLDASNDGTGLPLVCETHSERAEFCLRAAVGLKPDSGEAHNNLGVLMQTRGRYCEALACFEEAIRCQNDFAEARMNRGMIRLLRGRFLEGWEDYESRWKWDWFWECTPVVGPPLDRGRPQREKHSGLFRARSGRFHFFRAICAFAGGKSEGGRVGMPAFFEKVVSRLEGCCRDICHGRIAARFRLSRPFGQSSKNVRDSVAQHSQ